MDVTGDDSDLGVRKSKRVRAAKKKLIKGDESDKAALVDPALDGEALDANPVDDAS